ncbi:MAG: hypothetical protein E7554_01465 [Ruminococcaceae bacterium]|nr:hypothetical protein [Oscillospiraceae bacterium]
MISIKIFSNKKVNNNCLKLFQCAVVLALLISVIALSVFYPRSTTPIPETPAHTDTVEEAAHDSSWPEEEPNPIDIFFTLIR